MSLQMQQKLNQKRCQLKTLQDKYELNNKKIKLLRKQNQDMKSKAQKQQHSNTTLLIQSKELSANNTKLEQTVAQLTLKLNAPQHNVPEFVNVGGETIREETLEADLANKEVSDEEILELQVFNKIQSLILDNNKLTNVGVMAIIKSMVNLKKLMLNGNKFDSYALEGIINLKQLRTLQLNGCMLGDLSLTYISKCENLSELCLLKNSITDTGVQYLVLLDKLSYLDINNNAITDQGSKSIGKLKKLTHLYCGWNKLTHLGVRWLCKDLPVLEVLDVRFNKLNNQDRDNAKTWKSQKMHALMV